MSKSRPVSETSTPFYVLLYHGVYADNDELGLYNSAGKHIAQARFEAQMRHLSAARPLVSMGTIADALQGDAHLPCGAVAVTFDDGFLNNFTVAWPVLDKYQIPATIYLATGFIGTDRRIWTDQLEAVILETRQTSFTLTAGNETKAYSLANAPDRLSALSDIKKMCKKMSEDEKEELVDQLAARLGLPDGTPHPLDKFMDWSQVREMDESSLIDFGAHTADHVSLTRVSREQMREQIDRSAAAVAENLGKDCRYFSYPEGQPDDVDANVIDYLRACGFDHAPLAVEGTNYLGKTHPFHIARCMVGFEKRPYPFAEL